MKDSLERIKTAMHSNTFEACFFYKLLARYKGARFGLYSCIVLAIPYLIIAVTYIFFNQKALNKIPTEFWFEMTFASSWFVIGPILVFRFMKLFIGLQDKQEFTLSLRKWFRDNAEKHYKIYKYCMAIFSPVFVTLVVPLLVYKPDILTNVASITTGYRDIHYWLVILFMSWFLIYGTNAFAVITLMTTVIFSIKKKNVIAYDPTNSLHHKCINELVHICNKVVSYMCSGLVFLPIFFFFLRQQAYVYWIIALLLFYSFFLFAAITYPKIAIKSYVNEKAKDFLMNEKSQYFKGIISDRHALCETKESIAHQLRRYNSYLYIQELKMVCPLKIDIDSNAIITYLSITITLATSIPGFIELFKP